MIPYENRDYTAEVAYYDFSNISCNNTGSVGVSGSNPLCSTKLWK